MIAWMEALLIASILIFWISEISAHSWRDLQHGSKSRSEASLARNGYRNNEAKKLSP
jgi:hypothetical protein